MRLHLVLALVPLLALTGAACGKAEPASPPAAPPSVPAAPAAAPDPTTPSAAPAAPATSAAAPVAPSAGEAPPAAPAPDSAATAAGPGRLALVFKKPGRRKTRALASTLEEGKVLAVLVKELNASFRFPRDVTLRFEDCGESNAFYDEEQHAVQMCWELVQEMADNFKGDAEGEEDAASGLLNATLFTVLHELGHALVHVLDLPITGKEEDAVDQLATWLLVSDGGEGGAEMAIDGAISFLHDAEAEERDGEEPDMADEHALSEQRFYNIVCWVYGSKPDAFADLLESKDGPLPDARAEICPDEWSRLDGAWSKLLKPHLRH